MGVIYLPHCNHDKMWRVALSYQESTFRLCFSSIFWRDLVTIIDNSKRLFTFRAIYLKSESTKLLWPLRYIAFTFFWALSLFDFSLSIHLHPLTLVVDPQSGDLGKINKTYYCVLTYTLLQRPIFLEVVQVRSATISQR